MPAPLRLLAVPERLVLNSSFAFTLLAKQFCHAGWMRGYVEFDSQASVFSGDRLAKATNRFAGPHAGAGLSS
jgi:hypothetical protein